MPLAKSIQLSSLLFLWQCFHSLLTVASSSPQLVPDTLGIWRMMLLCANRKLHFHVGDLEQEYHCNNDSSVQDQLIIGEHQAKCRALCICFRNSRGREKPWPWIECSFFGVVFGASVTAPSARAHPFPSHFLVASLSPFGLLDFSSEAFLLLGGFVVPSSSSSPFP